MNEKINPDDLMNGVLGKIYDKLTEGDPDTVEKSPDNHLAWLSVPIPFDESDFDFMTEGFKGVARQPVFSPLNSAPASPMNIKKAEAEGPSEKGEAVEAEVLDTEMNKDDLMAIDVNRKYLQAENISAMLNYLPDVDGMDASTINVFSSEGRLSSIYEEVLNHCMVSDYEMDEATKAKVEKFKSKLVTKIFDDTLEKEIEQPSKMVIRYEEKKLAYDAAVLEYAEAKAASIVGTNEHDIHVMAGGKAKVLQSKKNQALKDWVTSGFKEQYEHIANFISHVEGRHMTSLIDKYKQNFETAQLVAPSGSQVAFNYTSLIPGSFARSSSWTEFSYSYKDYQSKYKHKKTKLKASAGGGFMGWGGKGKASSTTASTKSQVDATGFYLKFKICAVQIYRPWFHQSFLTNTSWKFDSNDVNYKDDLLSDGNIPAKGRMPAITTQCIFIKDLKLHYGEHHKEFTSQLKAQSASAKAKSPFGSAKFDASRHNYNYDRKSEDQKNEICVDGMQLIGFKCHLLGKCPNPNPEIEKWV